MKEEPKLIEPQAPEGSEDALAVDFVNTYNHLFRYTPGLGWMRCMAEKWVRDELLTAYDCARQIARVGAILTPATAAKLRLASAKTIASIIAIAKTDPNLTLDAKEWDADPFEFNTPGGIIDLRTGQLRQRGIESYLTKCAAVTPSFQSLCPTWYRFLHDVFEGDADMIEFVQRLIGYSLTGDRREQKVFFMYGQGGNGKSVLWDFVAWLVGSYALKFPTHALMHTPFPSHPTEIAQLVGVRLAISSETEEGQYLAESRVKELTGDEMQTARYMRKDFFEFRMSQKHVIVGNYKPRMKGCDAGLARRVVLVPFLAKFDGSRRDMRMLEKLRAEAPAVLAWAIQGAVKWHSEGLAIPSSVAAASNDYMVENDDLQAWIEERCVLAPGALGKAAQLYGNYLSWLKSRGQHAPSMRTWGERMSVIQGVTKRKSNGVVYDGIGLRAFEEGS